MESNNAQSFDLESYNLLAAPAKNQFQNGGSYFVMDTPPASVEVQLQRRNVIVGRIKGCTRGIKLHFPGGFDQWQAQMTSGAAGVIFVAVSDMDVDINGVTGSLNATILGGSGLTDSVDFVSAGGGIKEALLVANASRRTAIIRSASGNNAGGCRIGNDADVAANKGMFLAPGETYSVDSQAAISIFGAALNDKFYLQEVLA